MQSVAAARIARDRHTTVMSSPVRSAGQKPMDAARRQCPGGFDLVEQCVRRIGEQVTRSRTVKRIASSDG